MSSTRSFKNPGIFADSATTVIPPTPIAGVAYRDAVAGADDTPNGWRYGTRVASQDWNQVMFLLTSMMGMIDSQGVLGWSDQVEYAVPALVFGSNGLPYIALQSSGPSTAAQDPVSAPTFWEQYGSGGMVALTTTQSWSVPMAMQLGYIKPKVTLIAGGGAGSRLALSSGGGGGGGGGAVGVIDLAGVTSVSVTVGAGGAVAASGVNAGNGGSSSFGAFMSATGGVGGNGNGEGGNGGVGTGGSVNLRGNGGGSAAQGTTGASFMSGHGGGSFIGGGGRSFMRGSAIAGISGETGGGGGGSVLDAAAGGGGPGIVIIEW